MSNVPVKEVRNDPFDESVRVIHTSIRILHYTLAYTGRFKCRLPWTIIIPSRAVIRFVSPTRHIDFVGFFIVSPLPPE